MSALARESADPGQSQTLLSIIIIIPISIQARGFDSVRFDRKLGRMPHIESDGSRQMRSDPARRRRRDFFARCEFAVETPKCGESRRAIDPIASSQSAQTFDTLLGVGLQGCAKGELQIACERWHRQEKSIRKIDWLDTKLYRRLNGVQYPACRRRRRGPRQAPGCLKDIDCDARSLAPTRCGRRRYNYPAITIAMRTPIVATK